MNKNLLYLLYLTLLFSVFTFSAFPNISEKEIAQTQSPESSAQIKWQVVSSGSSTGNSTNFVLSGTVGQTVVGLTNSDNYTVNSGFWQSFATPNFCCFDITGNIDGLPNPDLIGVGGINISDIVYFVDFSFKGGPAPLCEQEADVDGSNDLNVSDIIYMIAFSFNGGPPPVPCP